MEYKVPPKMYSGICQSTMTELPLLPEVGEQKLHNCLLIKGHIGRHKCKCGATW